MIPRVYFNTIEELNAKCEATLKARPNAIEVVEIWAPCYLNDKERKRESHVEILRPDGYYDSIYFKIGSELLADEIYTELKRFNKITR
jgi:hypothetical protein